MTAGNVRGEFDRSQPDHLAVMDAMIDMWGRVSQQPGPHEDTKGKDQVGIITAGFHRGGAGLAGPELRARCLLQQGQAARMIGVGFRVDQHLDVPHVETELRNAGHDHAGSARVARIEDHVPLSAGDEEGGHVVRAYVVEVPGNAEGLGRLLSPTLGDGTEFLEPLGEEQRSRDRDGEGGESGNGLHGACLEMWKVLCVAK